MNPFGSSLASARNSRLPPTSRQPVSTKTASQRTGASRPTQNPGQHFPDEMLQQLVQELEQMGLKVSLKELQDPKNSPRLVTTILPDLIQKASVVPLDDAVTKHPQVHPKVVETIGLPALVQYFLSVFHPDINCSWFTVEDAAHPTRKRMLNVLSALVNIVGVSSRHDNTILEHYHTLKAHQDLISDLWNQDVNLKGREDQQTLQEEQEREGCAKARERLESVENDRTVDIKFNESVQLMEKVVKKRDSVAESVRRAESEVDQLTAKLAALQAQVITEEDAGRIQQQLQEAKSERKALENAVHEKQKDFNARVDKNKKMQEALNEAEMVAKNFFKFKEEACTTYGDLEEEKRLHALRLNIVKDEVNQAIREVKRAQAEVNDLKESLDRQKEERKLKQEQQKLYRNELQREVISMKDKSKEYAKTENSYETAIAEEEEAVKEQLHQISRLMVNARELANKREEEIDASASQVVSKKAEVDQRLEQMKKTFQDVYGSFPDKPEKRPVPEAVREPTRQIKELLRLRARIAGTAEVQIASIPLHLNGNAGDSSEDSNKENVE